MIHRFIKWSEPEYSLGRRLLGLIPAGVFFLILLPLGLALLSAYLDQRFGIPTLYLGPAGVLLSVSLVIGGFGLALWSIQAQLTIGRGTPLPIMATQTLIITRPFNYCRNPMALGTILGYLGIALWLDSISAVGLVLLFSALLLVYIKKVEEKELEIRFGAEYTAYKKSTPFLIPRFRR